MAPSVQNTLYHKIVEVTYEYLGPAAERFVIREIESHLNKKPEDITKEDITKLHDWSRLAIALLTEDAKVVDAYSHSLLSIVQEGGNHQGVTREPARPTTTNPNH